MSIILPYIDQRFTIYVISLVPPQTPEAVAPLVFAHLESEFAKLNTKNKMTIEDLHGGKPWVADINHWNYAAAIRATIVHSMSFVLYAAFMLIVVDFRRCINRNQT